MEGRNIGSTPGVLRSKWLWPLLINVVGQARQQIGAATFSDLSRQS